MENKQLTDTEVLELMKKTFPEFFISSIWNEKVQDYADDEENFTIGIKIFIFSIYFIEEIKMNHLENTKKTFDFVEEMQIIGSEAAQNAFTTGFLEYVINHVPEIIPLETFVQLLGPESKAYCKAWNDFCGIQMEGI